MFIIYGICFLFLYFSYNVIKKFLFISPELRQIPSFHLIQTIRWNKGYLVKESFINMIRSQLMDLLNKKGIVRVYDIFVGNWVVHISKPELMKEVFIKADAFQKIGGKRVMSLPEHKFIGTNNILLEVKEQHLRHRRASNPAFSHSWPPELFGNLAIGLFKEMDKSCEKNPSLNVFQLTKAYTLDALGLAAFGYNFETIQNTGNELEIAYSKAIHGISDLKYAIFPILDKTPGFKRPELLNKIDYLNDVILDIIKKRRQLLKIDKFNNVNENVKLNNNEDYDGPRDLLYYMLKAEESQDNKSRLTTEELLNDLKIFLVAGHDTTAIALSAAIYFLGMNQECQEKAREEIIRILGDEKKDVIPTSEQIKELKYINMIIKETLRIHPPAPAPDFRVAQKDTRLGEYIIKKDTIISLNIYSSNHIKEIWEDPHKFNPERFANENNASQYFPFGGGNRICIGMNISYAEQRVFLAMFVRKYSWNIGKQNIHNDKIKVVPALFGLSVPDNIYVNFERRY